MSLSNTQLNLIPTIDPRLNLAKVNKRNFSVETVPQENTWQIFPIQNKSIPNGFIIQVNPPNKKLIVNRRFYLQSQFILNFVGNSNDPGRRLLQCPGLPVQSPLTPDFSASISDAPRAYPLSCAMQNLIVDINGLQTSQNLGQYFRILTRYHNDNDCQNLNNSYTPTFLDQFLTYDESFNFPSRSELAGYGDNYTLCGRGGFVNALVITNTQFAAQVQLTVMEPLYISPLGYACDGSLTGFSDVSTITVTVSSFGGRSSSTFGGIIGSLWSHRASSPCTITGASVDLGDCNMLMQWFTPPLTMQIPRPLVYEYSSPLFQSTQLTTPVLAGNSTTLDFNTTELSSIPEKVYIWACEQDSAFNYTKTDTYMAIDNISINFNNKPSLVETARLNDLYNICVRNGTNLSYRQFVKDTGSVVCLRFGEDICLPTLLNASSRGKFSFSAKVHCKNNYAFDIVPQVACLFIYTGTYTIMDGVNTPLTGLLTENDVLNAQTSGVEVRDNPRANDALGGGISFSDIVSFFKRAGRSTIDIAKKIVPVLAPSYQPVVEGADVLAKNLGFGAMIGGKQLTRAQMLKLQRAGYM